MSSCLTSPREGLPDINGCRSEKGRNFFEILPEDTPAFIQFDGKMTCPAEPLNWFVVVVACSVIISVFGVFFAIRRRYRSGYEPIQ
jgi:hypothetical protein